MIFARAFARQVEPVCFPFSLKWNDLGREHTGNGRPYRISISHWEALGHHCERANHGLHLSESGKGAKPKSFFTVFMAVGCFPKGRELGVRTMRSKMWVSMLFRDWLEKGMKDYLVSEPCLDHVLRWEKALHSEMITSHDSTFPLPQFGIRV